MKNLRINKRLASLLLAMGISLSSSSTFADIISYNTKTTLKNGKEANIYFITGDTINDYAYVSFDNMVGYVSVNDVNLPDFINSDYVEINEDLIINSDIANVYSTPNMMDKPISTFHQNDQVHVVARNNDGWCVVSINNITGFIHESAFKHENKEVKVIKVIGNKVNVRLTPNTDTKNNIIGCVNSGDKFSLINHENGWYVINYFGEVAYISDSYGMEIIGDNTTDKVNIAKVCGCNVNIRSSSSTKSSDNIIGFADITDSFRIIDKIGDWYIVDYLGQNGYVNSKYVIEKLVPEEDLKISKMVYLKYDSAFYSDINGTYMTTLPKYQYASVIKEENGYYKVRVDGVIGYIKISDTKRLTNTFVVSDLGRQIVKVYKNNKEVYRAHIISGRESMQTDMGIYKIGHKVEDYQLTETNFVEYWIEYNGDEGLHDASWQKDKYYTEVSKDAYDRFMMGRSKTYPVSHGSHGCNNLKLDDARNIFYLVNVGDNVLVIESNSLVKDNLVSKQEKIKKLV